jgi:hypothetical protein
MHETVNSRINPGRRKAEQSKTPPSEISNDNQIVPHQHQEERHYIHQGRPIWHSQTTRQHNKWHETRLIEYATRLPVDQRLITLIQYNVLRACATNMSILNLVSVTFSDCQKVSSLQLFPSPTTVPESLQPTSLQLAVPHDRWIDLIPSPTMRDNAIRFAGEFDGMELCDDIVGGLYQGFGSQGYGSQRIENNGMLVWSDPWHVSGWELTDGFVKKWSLLLRGCWDMVQATNHWREIRGEEPLAVQLQYFAFEI